VPALELNVNVAPGGVGTHPELYQAVVRHHYKRQYPDQYRKNQPCHDSPSEIAVGMAEVSHSTFSAANMGVRERRKPTFARSNTVKF
jgi:hypothetical protein